MALVEGDPSKSIVVLYLFSDISVIEQVDSQKGITKMTFRCMLEIL